jgi:DNA-directed RNA polymerase sigma subunit (sigma70/sigma32)
VNVGSEPIRFDGRKSKARLKLARRTSTLHGGCPLSLVGARRDVADEKRLISSHDAAISKRLQEQTQAVLGMLSPRERLVLRLRFGISQVGDQLEAIDEMLTPDQMAFIEAMALRKLRHPSGARLRSVDRR